MKAVGRARDGHKYSNILDAAARVFDEQGYHEASMEDVADAAGLTKGGLYYYVDGKQATLFAINERYLTAGMEEIRAIATRDDPVEVRIRSVIVAIAGQHDTFQADLRVTLQQLDRVNPPYREKLLEMRDDYQNIVENLVAEGVRLGVLVDGDPGLMTKLIFGAINWMCVWFRQGEYSATEVGDRFASWVLGGLLRQAD